jgi:hypothetical protein
MAKFKPMELMSEIHGKFHGNSEYYAAERYGTQFTGKIGEIKIPPTEKQIQMREKFAAVRAKMATLSEEELATYAAAYKKYAGKYKSLQGYIFAQLYKITEN